MKVTSLALIVGLTVSVFHTSAASAQQPEGPAQQAVPQDPQQAQPAPPPSQPVPGQAPQQYPPGYGPPPGYAPQPAYGAPSGYGQLPPAYSSPPRYSYYPPPPPPPAPRAVTQRPFTLGASLGLGFLRYGDRTTGEPASNWAQGYSLRLGFSVSPTWMILIGWDGAWTYDQFYGYMQSTVYAGMQTFLTDRWFLRAGAGFGNATVDTSDFFIRGRVGPSLNATVGFEAVQGYNWSLEIASQAIVGFYDDERWSSWSVFNIGLNFF